ncbi:MAG: flagellar biosynthesis protein FlhB [Maricaulaceae bacterium]
MADDAEKTEDPTERRLQEARKKGDVAKSQELSGFVLLAAGTAVIAMMAPGMGRDVTQWVQAYLSEAHQLALDPEGAMATARSGAWRFLGVTGLAFLFLAVAAIAGHVGQAGLIFAPNRISPDFKKLNPASGLKRMFGGQGLANFIKGVFKLFAMGGAMTIAVWPRRDMLVQMPALETAAVLTVIAETTTTMMLAMLAVYALIAAGDYLYQRKTWFDNKKMSLQEIKEEHKNAEGDPHIKARLRAIRQERSRRRMMAAVPDATVVVTNPTHYAVALKYVRGETPAPICVAKGVDVLALRIRQVAQENTVPIVEDPPLARALYATVELDQPVPEEHYKAVAKVIGYVMGLAGRRARPRVRMN